MYIIFDVRFYRKKNIAAPERLDVHQRWLMISLTKLKFRALARFVDTTRHTLMLLLHCRHPRNYSAPLSAFFSRRTVNDILRDSHICMITLLYANLGFFWRSNPDEMRLLFGCSKLDFYHISQLIIQNLSFIFIFIV